MIEQMCKPSALRRRLSQYEYDIDLLYVVAQYNTEAREGRTSDISQSDIPVLKLLCNVVRFLTTFYDYCIAHK
jgi:hypothetical protein